MVKFDFKKENKNIYYPSDKKVSVVDIPRMNFLMIDGKGDPNTSKEYHNAMEALFPVSFKTKFLSKKELVISLSNRKYRKNGKTNCIRT